MDRLSALVQEEIMTDSPEQYQQQSLQQPPQQTQPPQQQQSGFDMVQQPVRFDMSLPMQQEGGNRRMAPPGLGGPPLPPPDWLNRGSFDPFNGQDPSLIAARRLQHSQRMLEASGLFGGAGFGHPPVVPRFGFSPNPNNGFLPPPPPHHHHQPNPPPPPHHPSMGMFPPPPHPHHPMMRPHPPPPSVDMMNMQNSPFGPLQHPNMQMDELRNEFNSMKMNGGQDHQQSRDDFRALLPNVNISFNNLQEKRRAEEFYQQQLIMQRQQQQMQLQQRLSEQQQQQQQQQQKDQIPIHMDNNNSPLMRNSFTDSSLIAQEKVLLKSPLNQQQTEASNPDVRVEAQNFFGEFLRKAASSTQQQQDMSPKKEEPGKITLRF
jgi:hypothetical protein